jgi:hypothetical protein
MLHSKVLPALELPAELMEEIRKQRLLQITWLCVPAIGEINHSRDGV